MRREKCSWCVDMESIRVECAQNGRIGQSSLILRLIIGISNMDLIQQRENLKKVYWSRMKMVGHPHI